MNELNHGWRTRLDRQAQKRVLERLAEDYPQDVVAYVLYEHIEIQDLDLNVAYLADHGLIEAEYTGPREMGNSLTRARLTHKGLDFLAEDGGLGAILGVMTVKLHEDTLKAIIESKVLASDLPEPEKKRFLDHLRELPGEATKHLVLKLLDAGMDNWHRALPLLQGALG
ncbi:hypothetical protein N5J29_09150 [Stenotrophomonas sp. GD03680]|uniref:hypothetical protein n=1 Tax=Stenotrophomonas sp. GD03680 TaxID=2975365 RepID=UPI0024495BB2|nr:hypothetical protein [Stenotrophomonas sp. GD03680]MDH2022922.1 hypothetical protein [Stenotrophomonas sp. GD03680]